MGPGREGIELVAGNGKGDGMDGTMAVGGTDMMIGVEVGGALSHRIVSYRNRVESSPRSKIGPVCPDCLVSPHSMPLHFRPAGVDAHFCIP